MLRNGGSQKVTLTAIYSTLLDDVPTSFWIDFSKEVKSVKKDFYLLGEIITNDPVKMASYAETGIDGFVDFPLNEELRKVFPKPDQSFGELFRGFSKTNSLVLTLI